MGKSKKPPFSGRQCVQEASAVNYFDKFFILKRKSSTNETFHSVSPFLVEKAISGYLGEIPSVRELRSGDLLVESRESDADAEMSSSSASEGDTLEYDMSKDLEDTPDNACPTTLPSPSTARKR
ncbi:hypothetical protein AVEN_201857-1 [Araneus ventricosus]|uniref:Uncharacterized protein n=1 Tax=Araneus ventricosus TaxID=182803 RepID=A0A4Y2KMY5_ARAVE|nr:hypothetical protein AVEN_201857-1 [Araneus ventricosus]